MKYGLNICGLMALRYIDIKGYLFPILHIFTNKKKNYSLEDQDLRVSLNIC